MRQLIRPRQKLKELGVVNQQGIFRAKLAEDYDGIGQYVMVALAGSAVGAAYKARVASGDFGGSRTFPAGTPVTVLSYRGTMEVLLGNIPDGCAEDFNRTVSPLFGDSEFSLIPWQHAWWADEDQWEVINGDAITYPVDMGTGPSGNNDLMSWVTSNEAFQLPIEILFEFTVEYTPWPPAGVTKSPFIMMGLDFDLGTNNSYVDSINGQGLPYLSASEAAVQVDYHFTHPGGATWESLTYDMRPGNPGLTNFPVGTGSGHTGGGYLSTSAALHDIKQYVRMRVTDLSSLDENGRAGTYSKWWNAMEDEPDDWTAYQASGVFDPVTPSNAIFFDDFGYSKSGANPSSARTVLHKVTVYRDCPKPGFAADVREQDPTIF